MTWLILVAQVAAAEIGAAAPSRISRAALGVVANAPR